MPSAFGKGYDQRRDALPTIVKKWMASSGISGWLQSEWVDPFGRNRWILSIGIDGWNQPEYAKWHGIVG
jgi:hypothetical protein